MAQKKLNPVQELELVTEYEDGWTVKELTIIYRISVRTVYRILAEHGAPKFSRKTRKSRKKAVPKEPRELKPCGTNAAYQRHRTKGEYPCGPCLEAHTAEVKKYAVRKPRKLKPCGTDAAYERHRRNGEPADKACLEAHNMRTREQRKK